MKFQPKVMSKLGLYTQSSGRIQLNISCLHQSKHYVEQSVIRSLHYNKRLNQIGVNSSLYWRIRQVLSQFEKAKRDLIKIQKKPLHTTVN